MQVLRIRGEVSASLNFARRNSSVQQDAFHLLCGATTGPFSNVLIDHVVVGLSTRQSSELRIKGPFGMTEGALERGPTVIINNGQRTPFVFSSAGVRTLRRHV